jgi:sec-independent protein translocase protein TatB
MLEVGWSELLVIAIILIVVVGPKDLPGMMRTFGRMMGRVRTMANEFRSQFDEAMKEADLDDVRKGLSEVNKYNPASSIRDAVNPLRKLGQDIKSDLQKASTVTTKPTVDEGTRVSELASDPVVDPEPAKAEPAPHKPVSSVNAPAPAATAAASEPVVAAKPAAKPARAKKAPPATDDYPPPARKVVKRKAPEPHAEHNLHVVADAPKPAAKAPRKPAAASEAAAKPAPKKKTAKTGDA